MPRAVFRWSAPALTCLAVLASACRDSTGLPNNGVQGALTVTPATATVLLGDTVRLKALYVPTSVPGPADSAVVWSTSDDRIATVDHGLVRALAPGNVTIAARAGVASGTATITVDTMTRSPVRGGVFQRLGALPVAGALVTVRAFALSGCSGAVVREGTTSTAADGTFATGIALPRFAASGGDCISVTVLPPAGGSAQLAGASVRLRWGDDVVPQVLSWSTLIALQPAVASPVSPGTRTWVAVSAGSTHSCALDSEGHPWCWGANGYGQLGASASRSCLSFTGSVTSPGSVPCSPEPLAAQPAVTLASLSASWAASCGLGAAGELYCWGDGLATRPTPVSGPRFVAFDNACGLDARGAAYCWTGWDSPLRSSPRLVQGVPPFVRLTARGPISCGLEAAGTAWCWGTNWAAQVGNGSSGGLSDPAPVAGGLLFRDVQLGGSATCALTPAGAAYCWGLDADGQLGSGRSAREYCPNTPSYIPTCSTAPLAVRTDRLFASITVGGSHACALDAWGAAYCWGANGSGQAGQPGNQDDALPLPQALSTSLRFRSVSAGGSHSCGISLTGGLYCWGDNSYGQLGDGTLKDHAQPELVVGSAP